MSATSVSKHYRGSSVCNSFLHVCAYNMSRNITSQQREWDHSIHKPVNHQLSVNFCIKSKLQSRHWLRPLYLGNLLSRDEPTHDLCSFNTRLLVVLTSPGARLKSLPLPSGMPCQSLDYF